jgi:hypothetical protein
MEYGTAVSGALGQAVTQSVKGNRGAAMRFANGLFPVYQSGSQALTGTIDDRLARGFFLPLKKPRRSLLLAAVPASHQ